MNYIISGILIAIFIIWELIQYNTVKELVVLYRGIFPEDIEDLSFNKETLEIRVSHHTSEWFLNIIETLNRYLGENSNKVSDYHLMKDVVDRNREVSESEIETIIPFTQYIGLVGTMLGIFVGVFHLVFGGGLDHLMMGTGVALASSGVPELLGGVALAVLTSAVGLGLTMRSSYLFKEAKRVVEVNENEFLSWIQSELLPNLSTDMTTTLVRMTSNLQDFNNTFASNTTRLDKTLSKVNESYELQVKLLQAIDRVDVVHVATANIKVYEKLKDCTEEIGMIGEALQGTRKYLNAIKDMTDKLDDADERTRTWENMGKFFEAEIKAIESRKAVISEAVGNVDQKLQSSFDLLWQTSNKQVSKATENITEQNQKLEQALNSQERVLKEKLQQMSNEIDERNKNLSAIFSQLQQVVASLPNEMRKYTSELSKLGNINQGIVSLQQILQKNSQRKIVDEDGTVIKTTNSTEIPVTMKIAVFIIALYSVVMILKEIPSFIALIKDLL